MFGYFWQGLTQVRQPARLGLAHTCSPPQSHFGSPRDPVKVEHCSKIHLKSYFGTAFKVDVHSFSYSENGQSYVLKRQIFLFGNRQRHLELSEMKQTSASGGQPF